MDRKEYLREYQKSYYPEWKSRHVEHLRVYAKNYRAENLEHIKEVKRRYYIANKKRIVEKARSWTLKNKDMDATIHKNFRLRNLHRYAALQRKRGALKLKAGLAWLTDEHYAQILSFYKRAAALSKFTGFKWHVDHIVPLQGRTVCGLHVPWNLQVLPAVENLKKSNSLISEV